MATVTARIEGLDEMIRALRSTPERLDKDLRKRFREIAADVRDKARAKAAGQRPARSSRQRLSQPQSWRDLVNTIRSGAESNSPTVVVGSDRVPWALGFEFGSTVRRQFPAWRGSGSGAGYFFWPTIRAEMEAVDKAALAAIDEALRPAFPD